MMQGQYADCQLAQSTAGAEVADRRLGREYRRVKRSEHLMQPARLPGVAVDRTQTVSVDVIDVLRADPRFLQGGTSGTSNASARLFGIERRAEAGNFRVDS